MKRTSGILRPACVDLALAAATEEEGLAAVTALLRNEPAVKDWAALAESVKVRQVARLADGPCGVCIAHGRSPAVSSLCLSAGRTPEVVEGVPRLFFVFAIPSAMDSEYLRVVGSLARICMDSDQLGALLKAPTAKDFAARLAELMK